MLRYMLATTVRVKIDNALAPGGWKNRLNRARDDILDVYTAWAPSALLTVESVTNSGWSRSATPDPLFDKAVLSASVEWTMEDGDPATLHQSIEQELKPGIDAAIVAVYITHPWIVGRSSSWDDTVEIDGETTISFHRAKKRRGQGHLST